MIEHPILADTCFWQGNTGALAQLTPPCFREDHHHKFGFARSNAVCTHRPDLVQVLKTCQREPFCREVRRAASGDR